MSERIETLHQQEGSMTVQEFADRHGITFDQAIRAAKAGKIMGARQDARSKKWRIYPPAKLLCTLRKPRSGVTASPAVDLESKNEAARAERSSRSGDMAGALSGHAVAYPTEAEFQASGPLTEGQQAKRAAVPVNVDRNPETLCVCRGLVVAARRNRKKGIHYLRLSIDDWWQVYFALREYRNKLRKAIPKGKAYCSELRATDNLWNQLKHDLATNAGASWI